MPEELAVKHIDLITSEKSRAYDDLMTISLALAAMSKSDKYVAIQQLSNSETQNPRIS